MQRQAAARERDHPHRGLENDRAGGMCDAARELYECP